MPAEVWCLDGIFLGSSHTFLGGVWMSRVIADDSICLDPKMMYVVWYRMIISCAYPKNQRLDPPMEG